MKYCILAVFVSFSLFANAQKWVQKSPIASTRDAAFCFSIGTKCYFGGGGGNKDFWMYDPDSNKWTQKKNLPASGSGRAFGAAFTIGSKGYIGLGEDANGSLKKDFWQYDPDSDKWTQKANYPIARDGVGFFAVGGKGYVGGGTDNSNIYDEFYEYDPAMDKWTSRGTMPAGYTAFPMGFAIGNKGYFAGGAGMSEYSSLYEYDPSTAKWTKKADFPGAARQAGIGFAIYGKGYVGLGQAGYATVYKDFYSYDPVADKWAKSADFAGGGLAWPAAAVIGGKAYVGGGWDFGSSFSNAWYQFTADTTTGIEEAAINNMNVKFWYNNISRAVNLQFGNDIQGPAEIRIYDITGKLLYTRKTAIASGAILSVSSEGLPAGVYIMNVSSGGNFSAGRIVISQ